MGTVFATQRPSSFRARSLATFLATALAVLLATAWCSTAFAEEGESSEKKTVRIAFYEDGDYMSIDEKGSYVGYNIDYLDEIARYVDWTYEYVEFPGFESAVQALEADQVDILPLVYYTEERADLMRFSSSPICEMYTTLNVRVDDARYTFEGYEEFSGMRVGVISDSQDARAFVRYSEEHAFDVEVIPYEETTSLLNALDDGTLDAVAITYLGSNSHFRTIAQFAPQPLHYAFSPSGADVATAFDDALDRLKLRDPTFSTVLYNRYFGINTEQDPVFTEAEYAYIDSAPALRVAYNANRAPLSFADPRTGEFSGMAALLFEDVARMTGLTFEFVPAENQGAVIDLVTSGEADIAYGIDRAVDKRSGGTMTTTGAFLHSPMALVVGTNPTGSRVALPEGFVPNEGALDLENDQITYYETPKACFDAVLEGRADMAYVDSHVASYLLSEAQYTSLSVTTITSLSNDMSIGVPSTSDPRLSTILDRSVQHVSENDTAAWLAQSSLVVHPVSPLDFLRQYPVQVIAAIVALFGALMGAALYLSRIKLKAARRIEELSFTDPLTGHWSLARFRTAVGDALADAKDGEYAIVYLDVKRFKSFNAAFGYATGDELLKALSATIGQISYPGERYAHITADEFVTLIRWEGWGAFLTRFEDLDRRFNDLPVLTSLAHRLSLYAGVCPVKRREGARRIDAETVIELMDCARYARDSIGDSSRSAAALYTEDMKDRDIAERALVAQAHDALERGEFVAYYQPKVEIATNRIVSFEALARWESPDKGLVQPGAFIPLFEKTGLVKDLDLQLFRQSCARIKGQLDRHETPLLIACNFSRLHLEDDAFPETLKSIADEYGAPVELLELELTENIVMEDLDRAEHVCLRLKELGFRIAIDDFGSGYSSLGTLQNLPIDVLKLDRSFLMSSESGERCKTILDGVVGIADRLGVNVVVEGVETRDQAAMLLRIDRRIVAQGFLYSRPVPADESDRQFAAKTLEPREAGDRRD